MSFLKKIIDVISGNTELDRIKELYEDLDDELDILTTMIYRIRKKAKEFEDENTIFCQRKLASEILDIINEVPDTRK